ncbi:MAG: HAD family phosphatase [Erysipelotrichaceae bacterium]|nr:HAD family phosphatase [Erysipelotrichaceae bacterium]
MLSKIKAVLFDLDGVLVNSEVVKHLVIKDFIEEKGYDIDHRLFFSLIGSHSSLNTWDEIFDQIDEHIVDQKTFLNEFAMYSKAIIASIDFGKYKMPYIEKVLELFKKSGIKLACASSSSIDYIYRLLDQCMIKEYFDVIVSGDDFSLSKPDPEIYLHCAYKLAVNSNECMVIEDSPYGIMAGKAAGMPVVAYKEEYFGLDQSKADYKISSYLELIDLFQQK